MPYLIALMLVTACQPETKPVEVRCKWQDLGEEVNPVTLQSRRKIFCPEKNETIYTEWQ